MSLPAFGVHLVPSNQSFVCLPPAVVEDILKHDENAVSLVLRLSWKSGSDSHETFVSWCGGISSEAQCIDIPQEFAACLGMGEGLKVKANIPKKKIKRAKTVNVSPLTADDWEVLELHPEELERQILNQINIVTQDMVVPIWTSNGAIIRVRIDEIQPEPSKKTPAARLDNTSEVIVAPRVRHKPAEQETEPADTKVWPTRLLRVLPNGCEMEGEDRGGVGGGGGSDPAQLTAVVSRTTMEKNGWSAGMLCSIGRASGAKDEGGCGARTHKSLEEKQDTAAAAKEASVDTGGVGGGTPPAGANAGQVYGEAPAERPTATGIFLYLAEQTSAGGLEPSAGPEAAADLGLEDHVVLSVEARRQLGAGLLTRVKVRPVQQGLAPPPLPTQPLLIQPVCWAGGGTGPGQPPPAEVPPAAAVLEAFAAFRARFAAAGPTAAGGALGQMMPVLQGSLLKLDLAGRALHVLLRFDAQQTFLCEPVPESEDGPASDVPPPAATAATTVKDIRWVDAATCPDRAKVTVGQAVELRRRPEPGFFGGPGLAEMVGVDSAKAAVVGYVLTQLAGAAARHSLGLPPGGGIIVHGQSGTGKSALAAAVGSAFRHGQGGHGVPAFTMTVDCGSFVGAKAAGLKLAWRELLDQAYRNAPTVIICDDLDQLVPEAGQDGQQAAARETVALGRFLADLLFPSNLSCLRPPGAAVAVIATCKDKGALSQRLRAIGRLDKEVGLSLPDAAGRAGQLRSLLAQLGVAADDRHLDLGALAARTDSFAAADLKRLAKRMAHHAAARYINAQPPATPRDGGGGGGPEPEPDEGRRLYHIADSKVAVTEADVELAMADGLAPAALQGVKLSAIGESAKGWAEVGGMAEVRATLREMFELPAKYPELFGTSPIRLRSGVLLYGPSGCGKTMMAAVIAKECGMHFISVKGPELLNKYIGASEQSVRQKFSEAKAARPCILFFDEFDSIAPRRGKDNSGVTDRVVNAFLTELDGVEERTGVYVLGATSRPDLIDPALLRPGRLDTMALCDFPNLPDRREILDRLVGGLDLAPGAAGALDTIASATEHYSGADLEAIINSAQLAAVHDVIEATKGQLMDANTAAPDVVVTGQALEDALGSARPSVSAKDRLFLAGVYRQFGAKLPPPPGERGTKLTMS